jgi:hypothetical protein
MSFNSETIAGVKFIRHYVKDARGSSCEHYWVNNRLHTEAEFKLKKVEAEILQDLSTTNGAIDVEVLLEAAMARAGQSDFSVRVKPTDFTATFHSYVRKCPHCGTKTYSNRYESNSGYCFYCSNYVNNFKRDEATITKSLLYKEVEGGLAEVKEACCRVLNSILRS